MIEYGMFGDYTERLRELYDSIVSAKEEGRTLLTSFLENKAQEWHERYGGEVDISADYYSRDLYLHVEGMPMTELYNWQDVLYYLVFAFLDEDNSSIVIEKGIRDRFLEESE